jgi:hypothetical protein
MELAAEIYEYFELDRSRKKTTVVMDTKFSGALF